MPKEFNEKQQGFFDSFKKKKKKKEEGSGSGMWSKLKGYIGNKTAGEKMGESFKKSGLFNRKK